MNFWHEAGLEVDDYYAKLGKTYFGFETAQAFDLVTICHVLEHIPHPRDTLKRIRTELKDDGRLYIEVPQIDRPYSGNLDRFFWVEHLNYFSIRTLDGLLRSEGFRITKSGELGYFLWAIAEKAPHSSIIGDLPLDSSDEIRQSTMLSLLHHQTREIKELKNKIADLENIKEG